MLAAAWTLRAGGHVRVDIFYARRLAAPPGAGSISVGTLVLLLPFMLTLLWLSVPYAARSWAILERSQETERPAAGVPAQDADPAVRAADGAAGRRAGDPRARSAVAATAGGRWRSLNSSPSPWWSRSAPR